MQTTEPNAALNIAVLISDISPKETSIERCKAKIETKASAKDIFLKVISLAELLFLALIRFIKASVIFAKE